MIDTIIGLLILAPIAGTLIYFTTAVVLATFNEVSQQKEEFTTKRDFKKWQDAQERRQHIEDMEKELGL